MKLIIDISKEQKKMVDAIMELPPQVENDLISAIRHGTPLPEHHGRLIDADVVADGFEDNYELCIAVNDTPTIIPATKEDCALTDCKCNNNGKCTDGLAYKESCYDCYQTATEEKSCKNCGHGFDSEDCYKCDKNIQNTCEPNQTATKEGE